MRFVSVGGSVRSSICLLAQRLRSQRVSQVRALGCLLAPQRINFHTMEESPHEKRDVKDVTASHVLKTLENLNFDNLALRTLPIDTVTANYVRKVTL